METININAPVKCSKKITVNASPEKIWQALTKIDQWGNWLTNIKKPKLNGELKVGATFIWTNGGVKIHSTIHAFEPYNNFGWTGKSLGTFAIHNWTIVKAKDQTEVIVNESMEGFLVDLFKKSFYKILDNGLQNWLVMLKNECEKGDDVKS